MNWIKSLWQYWKALKTWQQVVLLLPIIVLTAGLIILILSPIKPKIISSTTDDLITHNETFVNYQIASLEKEDKVIENKQKKVNKKIKKTKKEIERKEENAESIIKEIDNAGDDIDALLKLHDRLNSRNHSK